MPFYRRRTHTHRARRYGKKKQFKRTFLNHRKYKSRATMKRINSPLVMSDRLRVKLAYNTFSNYSSGAGTSYTQVYQSSAFDPDLTGSGNQPLGYDEWSAFYNKYRVLGIKWTITAVSTNSTNPTTFAVYPSQNSSAPGTVAGVLSTPYSKSRDLGIAAGPARATIKGFMSTRKIYGLKSVMQEEDFAAPTSASPSNLWYLLLYANAGSGAPSGTVTARLTYYIEFFDRKQLNIS